MKPLKYWGWSVGTDIVLAALVWAWQFQGTEQAGNVVVFFLWFVTVTRILCGFALSKSDFADKPRPAGFTTYHAITEAMIISTLVWIGYIWLPALYLFSALCFEAARNREPKVAGGAA